MTAAGLMSGVSQLRNITRFVAAHPLTCDHQLEALGRFLRWQIHSRVKNEVIVGWVHGTRLAVRRGMTGATGNIYAGLHEFHDMAFVLHFLRPEDLFADVGANVGSYTVLASGVARARSIAFEPDPHTVERLQRNVDLNALSGLVEIQIAAVGEKVGRVPFSVGRDTMNRVMGSDQPSLRTVPLIPLDVALKGRIPALMKLDVEGYEPNVLKGARSILGNRALKAILTENDCPEVARMLGDAGFQRYWYDGFQHRINESPGSVMVNALFLREVSFAARRVETSGKISVLNRLV